MSSEWAKFTDLLEAIVDNRGKTCPVGNEGIPLIATNCVNGQQLYPDYNTNRYVSDETYKTWFRGHPKPGDILFVCKGSPGRTNWVPDPVDFCIAQDMVAVRANPEKVYPKYLFAALRSDLVKNQIDNMHVGTMIPHFKKGDFDKLHIPMCEMSAQKEIGDLYFLLSERIEELRETNTTLEAIAQALFKSWFVDFDPVHANAAFLENGQAPSLPAEIQALFPSRLVESPQGLIPEGWEVCTIADVTETLGGATPNTKNEEFWNPPEVSWTSPKDLSGLNSPVFLETERKISKLGLSKISSGLLPIGTLLMSSRAPIGYLAMAQVPLAINQGYIAMPPGGKLPPLFMLYWCRQNMEVIENRANGSTFMEISKKAFRPIEIILPPRTVVDAFMATGETLFDRLVENEKQIRSLSDLRDTLLPRLISGQLRLPEAEAALAEVY